MLAPFAHRRPPMATARPIQQAARSLMDGRREALDASRRHGRAREQLILAVGPGRGRDRRLLRAMVHLSPPGGLRDDVALPEGLAASPCCSRVGTANQRAATHFDPIARHLGDDPVPPSWLG